MSHFRLIWNHIVTILSFTINILMLVTWQAKASLASPIVKVLMQNTTEVPDVVREWGHSLTSKMFTLSEYIFLAIISISLNTFHVKSFSFCDILYVCYLSFFMILGCWFVIRKILPRHTGWCFCKYRLWYL
jgi:hypothetical protein